MLQLYHRCCTLIYLVGESLGDFHVDFPDIETVFGEVYAIESLFLGDVSIILVMFLYHCLFITSKSYLYYCYHLKTIHNSGVHKKGFSIGVFCHFCVSLVQL